VNTIFDVSVQQHNKSCKVCGSESEVWGSVDFNKTSSGVMPHFGVDIPFLLCKSCGFLFTRTFDKWTKQEFLENIYNDNYTKIDEGYNGIRSLRVADWFTGIVTDKSLPILDYGAGNQTLGNELNSRGYNVSSWDPMWGSLPAWSSDTRFKLITAFEVFEHTPDPVETLKEMVEWLTPLSGQILISTYVNDVMAPRRDTGHWYLTPCGGHVCMHSLKSIETLFALVGMRVKHLSESEHLAYY
jgi:hypothetical protein